jgi:hypothetical protein
MNYESKATKHLARSLSPAAHLILAALRRELHVRLVFNHSSRHILYLSLPPAPSVLTYKANNRAAPKRSSETRSL